MLGGFATAFRGTHQIEKCNCVVDAFDDLKQSDTRQIEKVKEQAFGHGR